MAHVHANGDEEQRPRTPEEIAAIEEANRIAAQSNLRTGRDRRQFTAGRGPWAPGGSEDKRQGDRRRVVSDFERDMLLGEPPEGCAYTIGGKLIRYKKASHEDA